MPRKPPPKPGAAGSLLPLLTILVGAAALVAILLLAIGEPGLAAAAAVVVVLLGALAGFDTLVARRKLSRHGGDIDALDADEGDASAVMATDEEVPMGATREAHSDLDPHDLPPGHPAREEVERRVRARGG